MRYCVTGADGQLGTDIMEILAQRGDFAAGMTIDKIDIRDSEAVKNFISGANPDAVLHCAAYTAVDKAEDERELCKQVNVEGTRNIAETCAGLGCKLVYVSTDYVFGGAGEDPFAEDMPTNPIGCYGATKEEGERIVRSLVKNYYIVRTAWVFGVHGNNFVKTMLRLAKEKPSISVVNDQFGSPTYTRDLAKVLVELPALANAGYGNYHATNEGFCSWYEFTQEIFRQAKIDVPVLPVSSSAYPTKAKRPLNSRLAKEKLSVLGLKMPDWQDALARFLKESQV